MTHLRQARLAELAWVLDYLEAELVAVDYPHVVKRIKARLQAIETGKEP